MKAGIVILNYGTPQETCALVSKINTYACMEDIVVVDNKSPNNSVEVIEAYLEELQSEKVTFIKAENNGGYARGNNIGLRYLVETCLDDICFIANPDGSFKEEDIKEILDTYEACPEYGVLTCKRRVDDGSRVRQFWKLPTYKDVISDKFFWTRMKHRRQEVYEITTPDRVMEIEVAPGAFWSARSSLLKKVDYLDESTFLFYEENCFARRIRAENCKIGLVTNASYTVLAGKASTTEMKKNGKMMRYLLQSQRHYLTEYLHVNKLQLLLYDICCGYNRVERAVFGALKKGL